MFSSENIKWVKSVKRKGGSSWAYEEFGCDGKEHQKLHWKNIGGEKSAAHPQIGEIILLFQTVNFAPYKKTLRLTHLVTPVSPNVLIDASNKNYRWYREVTLVAKAQPIHIIEKPPNLKFNKVGNSGWTFPIDLLSNATTSTKEVQDQVWKLFQGSFCPNLNHTVVDNPLIVQLGGAVEGDVRIIPHLKQEFRYRNTEIVRRKKAQALTDDNGRIKCECCKFDFFEVYGEIGKEFIECHHKKFLSEGERMTNLEDLALVCSNCHRMLHRKRPDGNYYLVEELKELLSQEQV